MSRQGHLQCKWRDSATMSTWVPHTEQPSGPSLLLGPAVPYLVQAALGELAYEGEAAERLRLDIRSQAAKLRKAEEQCHSTEQALEASKASQQALEQRLMAAAQQAERQRDLEQRLSVRKSLPTCI